MKSLIIAIMISVAYIVPAKATSYWECLNGDCDSGIVIDTDSEEEVEEGDPIYLPDRSKRIWHPDGSQTIIDETPNGNTRIWHPDGSQTIIED